MKIYNDLIVEALEPLEIPLYYADIPEDVLSTMEYIYYKETTLVKDTVSTFIQFYEVAYISKYKDDLQEERFIDALESKGFNFKTGQYERLQIGNTSEIIDLFIMSFTKRVKRQNCVRG